MSILIKGMEMPKNDSWVNVRIKEKDGKPIIAFITGEDLEGKYFEIEEVPTPHGRLIDADELIGYLNEWLSDSVALFGFTRIINHQPIIIEAEVNE